MNVDSVVVGLCSFLCVIMAYYVSVFQDGRLQLSFVYPVHFIALEKLSPSSVWMM